MKKSRLIIIGTVLIALIAGAVLAGNTVNKDKPTELTNNTEELFNPETNSGRLTHAVDLWHDACLKEDLLRIDQQEEILLSLLAEDIREDRLMFKVMVQQVVLDNNDRHEGRNVIQVNTVVPHEHLNIQTVEQFSGQISTKEKLYESIAKTESFANKYRLLGDYVELLRRELKLPKANFVSNVDDTPVEENNPPQKTEK